MSSLLVVAGESAANARPWLIDYPAGRVRPLTNDFTCYRGIVLTQDGKMFSTVQAHGVVNLWTAPEGDADRATKLGTGNVNFYASAGNNVSWTPDGRIAFVSNQGGKADIWLVDPDGANRKQLTSSDSMNLSPVVSADGRYVVYVSLRSIERNIWRMDLDGGNPVRLTSGATDSFPSITPDGRWVVYSNFDGVKPTIWKVSIDGGKPFQITPHSASAAVVSPDGNSLAYLYSETSDQYVPNRLAVTSFEGGGSMKTFEIPLSPSVLTVLQWSPDGKSVLYTATSNNVTNIWSQPLDGGPAKQVTNFKEMLITSFAWSRDGKQLACSRGTLVRDAILVSDVN
ncbi:MAG TPA: DPP IV N-terminal domain-containing protein [Pyrinomonadaceae bacterium]|nr:DPP IV N-terminal domain-containing protein [Pyrinomonadaceae bacterium]